MHFKKIIVRFSTAERIWHDELGILPGETLRQALDDSGLEEWFPQGIDADSPAELIDGAEIYLTLPRRHIACRLCHRRVEFAHDGGNL